MLSPLRLQATQAVCASEDIAQSLQEAEALLDAHSEIKVSFASFSLTVGLLYYVKRGLSAKESQSSKLFIFLCKWRTRNLNCTII